MSIGKGNERSVTVVSPHTAEQVLLSTVAVLRASVIALALEAWDQRWGVAFVKMRLAWC